MNERKHPDRTPAGVPRPETGIAAPPRAAGRGRAPLALVAFASCYVVAIALGILLSGWIASQLDMDIYHSPGTDALLHRVVIVALLAYVLLTALPFVPGIEIGLALMLMFGGELALLVYLGTVLSLTLSFLIGRTVPERAIAWAFGRMRMHRARDLSANLSALGYEDRLEYLLQSSPARVLSRAIYLRYVIVALLFNLPGNTLIGGGGGIALAAGMSRLFTFGGFLLTLCVAVAPIPLAVSLTEAARP